MYPTWWRGAIARKLQHIACGAEEPSPAAPLHVHAYTVVMEVVRAVPQLHNLLVAAAAVHRSEQPVGAAAADDGAAAAA